MLEKPRRQRMGITGTLVKMVPLAYSAGWTACWSQDREREELCRSGARQRRNASCQNSTVWVWFAFGERCEDVYRISLTADLSLRSHCVF